MRSASLPLFSRMDRYVARLFSMSYVSAFLLVVGLYLILDMATNMDDYLQQEQEQGATLMVARYYLLQLPFLYLQMSPYVTLVAGMFTVAKMARNNEIVAALNAGVSSRRLLACVFVGAGILALGMFVLREWATDELGWQRDIIFDRLKEQRPVPVYENFWVRDDRGHAVHVGEYRPASLEGMPPMITGLSCGIRQEDASVWITAESATPLGDEADGRWQLEGGHRLERTATEQSSGPIEVLEEVRFTPKDAERAHKGREKPEELSFTESRELLARDPTSAQLRTILHYHLTFPFAGLVLLAVGLPFLVGSERGRAVERIALGFLLCVGFFGMDFVCRTLGLQGQLAPVYAGWLPILFFGSLGGVLLGSMRS